MSKQMDPIDAINAHLKKMGVTKSELARRMGMGESTVASTLRKKDLKMSLNFVRRYHAVMLEPSLAVLIRDYDIVLSPSKKKWNEIQRHRQMYIPVSERDNLSVLIDGTRKEPEDE